MKKILILLSIMFCSVAFAHTIEWYVSDNLLSTTTCESGDNITPPTAPAKFGYSFREWAPYKARIEYLESTGTQWIDTTFKPNQDTKVVACFLAIDGGAIFGERTGLYTINANSLMTVDNNSNLRSDYNGYERTYRSGASILNKKFIAENNKNTFVLYNEDNEVLFEETVTSSIWQSTLSLYIFIMNDRGNSISTTTKMKLYYLQIYNNNTLVRDFIPVLDPDGVPCLYDKVERKFYYNAGTGQFIAGPVIGE